MLFTQQLSDALATTPELQNSCLWMKENPDEFIALLHDYLQLMQVIDGISSKDLQIIKDAQILMKQRNIQKVSASHITTQEFVEKTHRKICLFDEASRALQADHPLYSDAIKQLSKMLYDGHVLFKSGGTPKDGDPASDGVIWGHTQARKDVKPEVLVHFIISHFLARFFSFVLQDFNILKEKDDFFTPMTSALLLNEVRNPNSMSITNVWKTPRENGGLSWLREEQIEAYRTIL